MLLICLISLQIDDLTLLFVHIHHLLNEYRPHQARETLRVLMDLQKRQRLETAKRYGYLMKAFDLIINSIVILDLISIWKK